MLSDKKYYQRELVDNARARDKNHYERLLDDNPNAAIPNKSVKS